jgi:hypothetical protein
VYALDSTQNGAQLWHQHLAQPVSLSQLPCGNINPYGITGTPVIDTAANVLYVVALQASPSIHHELYALNIAAGGSVLYHYPIDAPNTDPKIHGQRGALTLANNKIYVVYSGRAGDCGAYVGRVVGVNAGDTTGASLVSYALTSTTRGGIWAAAAADPNGNVYVASGNSGATGSVPDRGESVVKLSATLQELDFFTAPEWSSLNASDLDIGSIGPMLLQNGWILQSGKNGMGYLINSASMGHVGGRSTSWLPTVGYAGMPRARASKCSQARATTRSESERVKRPRAGSCRERLRPGKACRAAQRASGRKRSRNGCL